MKVIFIVLDTVRRDFLRAYGNDWVHTPAISKLAAAGVTFDSHFVGSLPCMPARREFMTGRYNFMYRSWGPIEPFDDVLPRELIKQQKAFTHLLTDHQHYFELGGENYHTAFNTWEFFRGQEYDQWHSLVDAIAVPDWQSVCKRTGWTVQQNFKNRMKQVNEEDYSGPRTVRAAMSWLDDNQKADNWFLQVELFDPHEPFTCTEKYREMYNDTWDGPLWDWPDYGQVKQDPAAVEHIRKCYAGLLSQTDHWIGQLFAKLEALRLWDDVTIVFTTDHGTMLAEHDVWMKNFMPLYNEIVRIPLIVKLPKNDRAGSRVGALTQTIDLMPTFMELFGAALPPHVHGKSILPMARGAATSIREDGLFGYFGKATNITDGKHVYMRNPVNADGGPLFAYTSMPIAGLGHFFDRELYDKMEMGRYLGHTYNLPLYKVPARGEVPHGGPDAPSYLANHQLFDIVADPRQQAPINDAKVEAHLVNRIAETLQFCGATPEQYTRLGLEPR